MGTVKSCLTSMERYSSPTGEFISQIPAQDCGVDSCFWISPHLLMMSAWSNIYEREWTVTPCWYMGVVFLCMGTPSRNCVIPSIHETLATVGLLLEQRSRRWANRNLRWANVSCLLGRIYHFQVIYNYIPYLVSSLWYFSLSTKKPACFSKDSL